MARRTQILAEGIYFGEGPRWRDGRLWFSDFHAHAVKSVSPAGEVRVEFTLDDQPSGLGWLPDDSLLVVSMKQRQVLRRSPDGTMAIHADLSAIAPFHCNDMVVDAAGGAYVGNFGFDLDAELVARGPQSVIAEHPTANLARIAPDGAVSIAAREMHFPNGSVITPDGATLIVGETLAGALTAFDIGPGGALANRRLWASTLPRIPDGICLDAAGHIWIANPIAPECALIAAGGAVIEVVETGLPCFACMLGGEDGRTLFMLTSPTSIGEEARKEAKGKLITAQVDSPGAGWP